MSEPSRLPVGISHVAFATGDLEGTIRFWRDLLGLRLIFGYGNSTARQYFFQIAPGIMVSFFAWEAVEAVPPKHPGEPVEGPFLFDHLAVTMESDEVLWRMQGRLDAAGFAVSDMIDHGYVHSIYTFDPNGIPLELCVPGPGVDLDAQPFVDDPQAPPAAREGSEPRFDYWPPAGELGGERIMVPGEGSEYFGKSS